MSMDIAPKLSKKFYDRAKWAVLKTDARTTMMNHNMEWITDGGQALFAMIQTVVESTQIIVTVVQGVAIRADGVTAGQPVLTAQQKVMAATAAKTLPTRTKASTNLEDYDDSELRKALAMAKGGSIKIRMNVKQAKYLQAIFGAAWNSCADMGVDDDADLKDMHASAL